jgi:DNA repair protein RadD
MSVSPQAVLPLGKPLVLIEAPRVIPVGWLEVLPPQADCLREPQRHQLAELARALRTYLWILMQAPTGAGKTHMIAAIVIAAISSGLRVLVLATRTRLVRQIHDRFTAFGIHHGVIAASLSQLRNNSAPVQVASVDTLYRRAIVRGKMPMPSADLVIFDEAHLATADTRQRLLDSYPKPALRLGFTATPARKGGRSLAAAFDCLVLGPSVSDLTAAGVLVPTRIFNTPLVTPEELRALPEDIDSDFQPKALGELLSRTKLIGDVVTNWLRIANGKRTLCFAVNKGHAAALLDSFQRQGVSAEMLTEADDEVAREQVIGRLESGHTMVVINCFLMSYGVDIPSIECIILARPTRSLTMYLQMVGRGLRASPGKTHCILIDHGHVVEDLGLPQAVHEWTLDEGRNVNAEAHKTKGLLGAAAETVRTCGDCSTLWLTSEQGTSCPECGWTPPQHARAIDVQDADLEEMADTEDTATPCDARVMDFYRQAVGWYARCWRDRWAAKPNSGRWWAWLQTVDKFRLTANVPPSAYWKLAAEAPSIETVGWLKHKVIKQSRARAKAAA